MIQGIVMGIELGFTAFTIFNVKIQIVENHMITPKWISDTEQKYTLYV
jgi:hypothetical protein